MKKQVLLATALCSVALSSVNAQLQTTKKEAVIGFTSDVVQPETGNKLLEITFNTTTGYTDGSESSKKINCNNTKGLCGAALTTEGINSNLAEKLDQYHWATGTNQTFKVKRYKDVASLIAAHTKVGEGIGACSTAHNYWKNGMVLMDVPGTDAKEQAWAIWGGINKRKIMMIAFKGDDGLANLVKDIEFEMMTLDAGTTGKTATYKMILDLDKNSVSLGGINKAYGKTGDDVALLDSINSQNIDLVNAALGSNLYVLDNVYTTLEDGSLNKKTIKLAESMNLNLKDIRGKKINIILYATTSGTPVQPGMYEPTIGIKNIRAEYSTIEWIDPILPDKATADTVKAEIIKGEETAIKFRIADKNRFADLVLLGDGDNKMSTAFFFKHEGCVMAKNEATGVYDIPVPYVYKELDDVAQAPMSLTIPGNVDGSSVNDDLEITIYAKLRKDNGQYRLEVKNGLRLLIDVLVTAIDNPNSVNSMSAPAANIRVQDNNIIVDNATEEVMITNTAGQIVKVAAAEEASKGIVMAKGIYVVKTGNVVEKALVK